MNFPTDLKYTSDHEWIRVAEGETAEDGRQIAYVGITDYAQSELGDLVYVEVETVGETLNAGETFGAVEAVKTTSDLYMPVGGEILEFNAKLDENEGDEPGLINSDPYGEGWLIKIKMTDPSELEDLMDSSAYADLIS